MKRKTCILISSLCTVFILGSGGVNYILRQYDVDISPAVDFETENSNPVSKNAAGEAVLRTEGFEATQALSRPLFSSDRREFIEPEVQEQQAAPEPPPVASTYSAMPVVTLVGTRLIDNTNSALVVSSEGEEPNWLVVGDLISGWTISEISSSRIVLASGDQSISVELYPQ
jgi:hypothetical protein